MRKASFAVSILVLLIVEVFIINYVPSMEQKPQVNNANIDFISNIVSQMWRLSGTQAERPSMNLYIIEYIFR